MNYHSHCHKKENICDLGEVALLTLDLLLIKEADSSSASG